MGWAATTIGKLEKGVPEVIARRQYGKLAKLYKVTFDDIEGAVKLAQRKQRPQKR